MELDPSHLMKLEEIVTLLDLSDDCTIAFVRCNEPVLCDAICKEIFERVHSRIHIYRLEMNEKSTNLFQLLEETTKSDSYNSKIEENKKIAFFVFGLDSAVKKKNISGKSEALLLLNMMREKFLEIKHLILIWINSASLNLILDEAQDFFSWRTTIFEFDIKREITSSPMFEFGDFDGLDKKRLEKLIEYYSNLIKDSNNSGIKDPYKFAYWNYNLGTIKLLLGYSKEALKYLDTAESISSRLDNKNLKESIYSKFGVAYSDLGEIRKAIEYHEQALKISREIGDRRGEGTALGNLGSAYSDLGEPKKAIEYYEQALKIAKEIGDRRGEGNRLGNLGVAYSNLGEPKKAIEYYEQALKISREIGDRRGEGADLGNLGLTYSNLGEPRKAIEFLKQALAVGKAIEDPRIISICEQNLKKLEGSEE
jgi:tetratricopeptide (TPR) repeat protein